LDLDLESLKNVSKSINKGSRTSNKYKKPAQALLELLEASSGFVLSLDKYKQTLIKKGIVEVKETKEIPYGYTDFRVGYQYTYNGKTRVGQGTMSTAIKAQGEFYFTKAGNNLVIVPKEKYNDFKAKLKATRDKDLKKLLEVLETNYKALYTSSLETKVKEATS